MGQVLQFKSKQDRQLEDKLSELSKMFDLIRKENSKIKTKLVLLNREGFIKIMEGDGNIRPYIDIAKVEPFSLKMSQASISASMKRITFRLRDELSDGSFLYAEE